MQQLFAHHKVAETISGGQEAREKAREKAWREA